MLSVHFDSLIALEAELVLEDATTALSLSAMMEWFAKADKTFVS